MVTATSFEALQSRLRAAPRRWLVTGVAGFIGSNLLETLLGLDQHVVGLDNFATGHQRNLDEVRSTLSRAQWSRFKFINGDIRVADDCRRACEGVDIVLHQAAIGSVPRSIADPITTNAVNIDGFLNMLVAARDARVRRFVYAASSSTYGDHPGLPKVEDRIGAPLSPYAVTKYVNELYADVFARSYGCDPCRPALLQRVRPTPGSRGRLRRRDPEVDRRHDRRSPGPRQRRWQHEPRLLLRRQRRAGQPAGGTAPRTRRR